ncbi:MAG: HindVP family restriction endonuclease [Holophagaceae bacterium]|nr:HindVP family restriction endonuclease [Holophagaceae bacterium]
MPAPSLFGITNSNKNFAKREAWGKNQFNSTLPASLVCWLGKKGLPLKYLKLVAGSIAHDFIDSTIFLGMPYNSPDLRFEFECIYMPYQQFVFDRLPRIDLVTMDGHGCLKGIEIKLTALPDETTYDLPENQYGCEIVVRPDTIVYLALSIVSITSQAYLKKILSPFNKIQDWTDAETVLPHIKKMKDSLVAIMKDHENEQSPLILQPIWKTKSKSQVFADNAFDVFIWSNFATTQLFLFDQQSEKRVSRYERTLVWLIKMLLDYASNGRFNHKQIIDNITFNTKNDKAFATSGNRTQPLMDSPELLSPRIPKTDIKHIILGGGHNMLSPERRLDATILSNLDLFR